MKTFIWGHSRPKSFLISSTKSSYYDDMSLYIHQEGSHFLRFLLIHAILHHYMTTLTQSNLQEQTRTNATNANATTKQTTQLKLPENVTMFIGRKARMYTVFHVPNLEITLERTLQEH